MECPECHTLVTLPNSYTKGKDGKWGWRGWVCLFCCHEWEVEIAVGKHSPVVSKSGQT